MKTRRALALGTALLATALLAAACGDDANNSTGSSSAGRVVEITMTDMAYSPATLSVTKGETVTFRFRNNGQSIHEALIGDDKYQMDHGASMTSSTMAGMSRDRGMGHGGMGAENMVSVKPGKSGDMIYRFNESGAMVIGCHQPGHYEAGMKVMINVT